MKTKLLLGAIGVSFTLLTSACVNNIENQVVPITSKSEFNRVVQKAKLAAADKLRDPEAARFKPDFQAYKTEKGDEVVCGTLNGKNAMGGYVGYRPFYIRMRGNVVEAFQLPGEDDEYNIQQNAIETACSQAASGILMTKS